MEVFLSCKIFVNNNNNNNPSPPSHTHTHTQIHTHTLTHIHTHAITILLIMFLNTAVRNFPTFLTLYFSLFLLVALGNRLKFHINLVRGFKKLLNGFIFLKRYRQIHFVVPPMQVYCLGCNYCI